MADVDLDMQGMMGVVIVYMCGLGMDMGIDVQGYVDLVQLLSGINNVDIWGRPSVKNVCFPGYCLYSVPAHLPLYLQKHLRGCRTSYI